MRIRSLAILIALFTFCTSNCESQILGKLINAGVNVAKEAKAAKKKNKESEKMREAMQQATVAEPVENSVITNSPTESSIPTMTNSGNENSHVIENPKDEIALTVSADGATKDEATKIALRSAIEQAYGTFVSANTTILNDKLVKDEIVTIANGNIKSYKEVASALLPNGHTTVTLNTIVCVSKLVSYAQSKGASTEFAGATFAMNAKMKELNKTNEKKALDNLIVQIKSLLPTAFDGSLIIGEPTNHHVNNSFNKIYDRYEFDSMPLVGSQSPLVNVKLDNYYLLPMAIVYQNNNNTSTFFNLIESTLKSLEPTEEECKFFGDTYNSNYSILTLKPDNMGKPNICRTRLSRNELIAVNDKINKIVMDYLFNIEIEDNTGKKSTLDLNKWIYYWAHSRGFGDGAEYAKKNNIKFISCRYFYGTGIFSPVVSTDETTRSTFKRDGASYCGTTEKPKEFFTSYYRGGTDNIYPSIDCLNCDNKFSLDLVVLIPKTDISKYSSFTIQHKSK